MLKNEVISIEPADANILTWGDEAPRGGKAVVNRILKDKATVPLFFAQTLISSLRDVGYNHTTSALCEHVDNAIEAGASEVRIFFRQSGKRGAYEIDTAVYDNGRGMAPTVLKVATSFGGSLSFNNRQGIGRFGMGMKTAALSMSPVMELYSWQEKGAFYNMTLDVEAIGKERANLVELPEPTLLTELPDEVSHFFVKPMVCPDTNEQDILASDIYDFNEKLGSSGTIVYMPMCDRLSYATARTLVDHAVKEMSRVYRRAINGGLRLYVNNRVIEAFDPTYSMADARHARFLNEDSPKQSRLILTKSIDIRIDPKGLSTAPIIVKIYKLPIEDWSNLPRKTLKNDLRVFDGFTVSILRNDREVFAGEMTELTTRHSVTRWYRIQIDFPGILDEAFGIAANKQGVRLKGYVLDAIKRAIGDDITNINESIKRFQGAQASARVPARPSASETRASDADSFQAKPLPENLTPDEQAQIEANLRGLAVTLKRDNETEEQALERVKNSRYLITFRHDDYWPFYHVEHRFGRIILTINTAHPFFAELYDPIQKLGLNQTTDDATETAIPDVQQGPIVALELLLLSLARAQSILSGHNEEAHKLLENFRREWSETYRIQLTT
jgi:hypothetical protein